MDYQTLKQKITVFVTAHLDSLKHLYLSFLSPCFSYASVRPLYQKYSSQETDLKRRIIVYNKRKQYACLVVKVLYSCNANLTFFLHRGDWYTVVQFSVYIIFLFSKANLPKNILERSLSISTSVRFFSEHSFKYIFKNVYLYTFLK